MTVAMTTDEKQRQRRQRNLALFAAHVALALGVLAWFVWSVTHK